MRSSTYLERVKPACVAAFLAASLMRGLTRNVNTALETLSVTNPIYIGNSGASMRRND